jgi:hypothetical protein
MLLASRQPANATHTQAGDDSACHNTAQCNACPGTAAHANNPVEARVSTASWSRSRRQLGQRINPVMLLLLAVYCGWRADSACPTGRTQPMPSLSAARYTRCKSQR